MKPVLSHLLRPADLSRRKATHVRLVPDAGQLEALADRLGVDALRKVRLEGELRPGPGQDWVLDAALGATVVQPCRVTTDSVTTRIEEPLRRRYSPDYEVPAGDEAEMPEDDSLEPLPAIIDMGEVLEEALALSIPAFPRASSAEGLDLSATPPGAKPIEDDKIRPFAALAALKDRLQGKE
ncbi:DUF177 domain-containing protein [uncultured Jannaschia sp.]|uniref:YceD family protein n=1 Tax=uncultured Jannaschia sp. TaxID=293347 RepID=UPI0026184603|nr:DUF177 domain-containing protein [uncultured Jannaschia sp.]